VFQVRVEHHRIALQERTHDLRRRPYRVGVESGILRNHNLVRAPVYRVAGKPDRCGAYGVDPFMAQYGGLLQRLNQLQGMFQNQPIGSEQQPGQDPNITPWWTQGGTG